MEWGGVGWGGTEYNGEEWEDKAEDEDEDEDERQEQKDGTKAEERRARIIEREENSFAQSQK